MKYVAMILLAAVVLSGQSKAEDRERFAALYHDAVGALEWPEQYFGAYVLGVTGGLQVGGADWISSCIVEWRGPQTIAVIRKYFREHPEMWDHGAAFLVQDALSEACSQ